MTAPIRSAKPVLVAGVGNIFLKDDAFGPKVIEELQRLGLPHVDLVDFGIRSWDLIHALVGEYKLKIIVDVSMQGHTPGTLYVIEPGHDLNSDAQAEWSHLTSHSVDLVSVFTLVKKMGGSLVGVTLLACEPLSFEFTEDDYELSGPVKAAARAAVEYIIDMIKATGVGCEDA